MSRIEEDVGIKLRARPLVACVSILAAVVLIVLGCSEDVYIGEMANNIPPMISLTNGPLDGDTTVYQVHFFWLGSDLDGWIDHYEFVVVEGNPIGFDPADTTGSYKWQKTERTDRVFRVYADKYEKDVELYRKNYSRYVETFTLFIRAVDNRGAVSKVAYCSFTAWTLAPFVFIETPKNTSPGHSQTLPPIITFGWWGKDPIDMPYNSRAPTFVRYLYCDYYEGVVSDMNAHPENFDSLWTKWIPYYAPGDSGRSTVLGDDEILTPGGSYIFAVQAMDEAGAITTIFDAESNVRHFMVKTPTGPVLAVREPYLGSYSFLGLDFMPVHIKLPEGLPLNLKWFGDASRYGCEVSSYRYGWNVSDYSDPKSWAVNPSPYVTSMPETRLYAGNYILYIEAVDNLGTVTLAQFEFEVLPVNMERNLLWVDDFYSLDFVQKVYAYPTETEHDEFWLGICNKVKDFSPDRDVYDTAENNFIPPSFDLVWRYKNVLWTFTSDESVASWENVVRFIPSEWRGIYSRYLDRFYMNYLAMYLASGGHVWTEGKSDRGGGLIAVLPSGKVDGLQALISPSAHVFPNRIRCEVTGPQFNCSNKWEGTETMVFRDYCVTVLDKPDGVIRDHPDIHDRYVYKDAMTYAYRDNTDPVTIDHPGLPGKLELWEQVTAPGMHFDPLVRGFTYVEVYDPKYWLEITKEPVQPCLHPIYRMRARNAYSVLHKQTVAFWTTKYADVVPAVEGGVAAPSVHFGLPLWFFDRAQVDSIANVVFEEWQILEE